GWVGFNVDYRLSPRATWPAQIVDVKRAIGYVREHADEWDVDPSFVAITGGSAGGHLSALAALTAGEPAFQAGVQEAEPAVGDARGRTRARGGDRGMSATDLPLRLAGRAAVELHSLGAAFRAGMLAVEPPQRTFQALRSLRRYGVLGGELSIAAIRHGERTALVDDLGQLSYAELDRRSNALANAWRERGIG